MKNRGSSVGKNDDKLDPSSIFYIIGDSDNVAQFIKVAHDLFDRKIESLDSKWKCAGRFEKQARS